MNEELQKLERDANFTFQRSPSDELEHLRAEPGQTTLLHRGESKRGSCSRASVSKPSSALIEPKEKHIYEHIPWRHFKIRTKPFLEYAEANSFPNWLHVSFESTARTHHQLGSGTVYTYLNLTKILVAHTMQEGAQYSWYIPRTTRLSRLW